jgi:hypothetical protein
MSGIEISHEVADQIALASMKEQLSYMETEIQQHRDGGYMHPEDAYNAEFKYIPALRLLISYYGG